jgi:hypothetical protein
LVGHWVCLVRLSFRCSRSSLSIGLKHVPLPISTHFSPTENKLLENLKEKTDQKTKYPTHSLTLLFQCIWSPPSVVLSLHVYWISLPFSANCSMMFSISFEILVTP